MTNHARNLEEFIQFRNEISGPGETTSKITDGVMEEIAVQTSLLALHAALAAAGERAEEQAMDRPAAPPAIGDPVSVKKKHRKDSQG